MLKNYANHWPTVQKWSYQYLREKLGNQMVKLHGTWQDNDPTVIETKPIKE